MASHTTHLDEPKSPGGVSPRHPTPQEELENLGLLKSGRESHATHHPQPGHDDEDEPAHAGSREARQHLA